ncbi:hypothetical protein [Streptomyces sp. MMBL 11-1]|uniref:hypothetical protein n=1 Tax=Streptomyces sp. MMBL 11-1 TaxID=3026420 RepID=UPI00235F9DD1|nr:hypothetical protein [Streptomyces sp. MMBL 11-1]
MSAYNSPADELAEMLARFAEEYPTDGDDAETFTLQLDGGRHGAPPPAVTLQAGQLAWLTQLVERELATARNAHCDGNGQCAHCEATGSARPTGPVTHVAAWFPGDLLTDDPDQCGWELLTIRSWEAGGSAQTLVYPGDTPDPDATAEQLLPLVAERFEFHGPIRLTRSTYTIEGIGRNEPGYQWTPGPWTYPVYEVTSLVPHQHTSAQAPANQTDPK